MKNVQDYDRPPGHSGLFQVFTPTDLTPKWMAYVTTKVKAVRVIALSGRQSFSDEGYEVPNAVGIIELTGSREGRHSTLLQIGFTDHPGASAHSFVLEPDSARGTLTLPAQQFSAYLQVANAANAHFRIGGDGSLNAVASEPTMLRNTAAVGGVGSAV